MSSRVVATPQAEAAADRALAIAQQDLLQAVNSYIQASKPLLDPNDWDGPSAQRWRSEFWPPTEANLRRAQKEAEQTALRRRETSRTSSKPAGV